MQGLYKTKAALPGRQCHNKKTKPSQDTTAADHVNNYGEIPVFIGHTMRLTRAQNCALQHFQQVKYLIREQNSNLSFAPSSLLPTSDVAGVADLQLAPAVAAHAEGGFPPSIRLEAGNPASVVSVVLKMTKGGNPPLEQNQCVMHLPPYLAFGSCEGCSDVSNGYSFTSLACLRRRRLISPLAAVTRNDAVLSPSSFRRSISSITSWGIRMVVICDFAFFAPVAIAGAPCVRCIAVYAKKRRRKDLRCISLWSSFSNEGDIHLSKAKPGSAVTLTGPLTKPLNEVTVMADQQHTQTHPKFTWHFLALPRADMSAKPCHLSISAESEKEARRVLAPYFILSLSGRLPAQEVRHA